MNAQDIRNEIEHMGQMPGLDGCALVEIEAGMVWHAAGHIDDVQFVAEAGPGDFIYVPPYVPHQEINASETEILECVLCRSDGEAIAINLDIEPVEKPETVLWIDPTHPQGGV